MIASRLPNSIIVPAALAGVFVGATVVTLEFAVLFFSEPEPSSQWWILPAFWAGSLIVFLLGFIFLGVPAWFAAEYFHRYQWFDAVVIGAVLTGAAEFVWALPSPHSSFGGGGVDFVVDGRYTVAGWFNAIKIAAAIGFGGAASGLTIWWIAYRKRQ